jgi:queuine/archaeosine tRNA-ribosyltransferase
MAEPSGPLNKMEVDFILREFHTYSTSILLCECDTCQLRLRAAIEHPSLKNKRTVYVNDYHQRRFEHIQRQLQEYRNTISEHSTRRSAE